MNCPSQFGADNSLSIIGVIMKDKKLRFWGAADIGEGFLSTVSNTYFSLFLTDVALLPLSAVSFVMMITSVFDFIAAPVAGGIISGTKPMKWGKIRSWLLVAPPIAMIFSALSYIPYSSATFTVISITVCYIIARAAYNISWAGNLSLINVVADTPDVRTKLTSQRMAGFNIGKLSCGYITPVLASAFASAFGEKYSYALVLLIAGILLVLGQLTHFAISKGYENSLNSDEAIDLADEKPVSLKEMFVALGTNPQLLITVCVDLTSNMGSFLLPALATYYYKYVAEDMALMSLHMLLTGFGGLIGSVLIRTIGNKIKDHRTFLCFVYPIIAILLFSCRFVAQMPVVFMILNIISQTLTGTTQPLELQLYMDNVIYHKYKTGVDANSFIMSLSNMPVKFATILKSAIIPFVLMQAGFVAGMDPTPELKQGIINAYTIIPAIIPVIGFILLKFFYKLSRSEVIRMKEEMEKE